MGRERKVPPVLDPVPEGAKAQLMTVKYRQRIVTIGRLYPDKDKEIRYSPPQFARVLQGYDCLQNLIFVRHFIQKKYEVDLKLLEFILYLAPFSYFTFHDYYEFPKPYRFHRIGLLIESGHIVLVSRHKHVKHNLYKISTKMNQMVVHFYKLLSGEEKIPEDDKRNPMAKPDANLQDKRRMALIKKLSQQPESETRKFWYKKRTKY